jgi:hypothetical protein
MKTQRLRRSRPSRQIACSSNNRLKKTKTPTAYASGALGAAKSLANQNAHQRPPGCVPLLLFVPGPTLPELEGAELPVPAPTMPVVLEPERPGALFMDPLVRPVSPGPDPLVVAELLVGPLSDPPLPWLDCANAGNAASDNTQATRTVFFIDYLHEW